jgi:hypothetical protein
MIPERFRSRLIENKNNPRELDMLRVELYMNYPNAFYSGTEKPVKYLQYPFEIKQ